MKYLVICFLLLMNCYNVSAQTLPVLNKPKVPSVKPKVPNTKSNKYTPKKNYRYTPVYGDTSAMMKDTFATPNSSEDYNFFDDFTDNTNEWDGITDDAKQSFSDGKCIIQGIKDNLYLHPFSKHFPINIEKDFTCSVICRWKQGVNNSGFGIYYCSNSQTWYSFLISAIGAYVIGYSSNSSWTDLISYTSSTLIHQNEMSNVLKINKSGDYLHFYINDTLLSTLPYEGVDSNFGFEVQGAQTVSFDNFRLEGTRK